MTSTPPAEHPTADDLGEQRVDRVAHPLVGGRGRPVVGSAATATRVTSRPVASRSASDLAAPGRRGRGARPRAVSRTGSLGHAQQQVPLARLQRWRTPRWRPGRPPTAPPSAYRRATSSGSGAAPTARAVSTTAAHQPWARCAIARATSARVGVGVRGDQRRRLVVVESEQVAAQHREVAEQLGRQPGERQVPARREQQPERLRVECRGRSSIARIVASGSRCASSTTTSAGRSSRPRGDRAARAAARRPRWRRRCTQVVSAARPVRCSQPLTPSVLPEPAGPTSSVTEVSVASSSRFQSRSRRHVGPGQGRQVPDARGRALLLSLGHRLGHVDVSSRRADGQRRARPVVGLRQYDAPRPAPHP